jgi:hypothetical protein
MEPWKIIKFLATDKAEIAVENGISFLVGSNQFSCNRYGILLWSKYVQIIDACLPENTTSLNFRTENNTFIGNYQAIRIAANQDHSIRPLYDNSDRELAAAKPINYIIRYNKFEENNNAVEEINTLITAIDINNLRNNRND